MSASLWSAQRLAPGPFVAAAVGVYVLGFLSQMLLAGAVTERLTIAPFVLVQIVLITTWITLHRRRLRDAGRRTGGVIAVAAIYALEMLLLVVLVSLMLAGTSGAFGEGAGPHAGILQLFVIIYFLMLLGGDASLGVLQAWIIGFIVAMLIPVVLGVGFSLWAAMRPRLAPPS